MEGEPKYNCEVCGGNHPTEEHSARVETSVKVEAKSAKDVLESWYEPEPDYEYDISEEYSSGSPWEEEKEKLPYIPFEPRSALRDLRKLSPAEKELPIEERRAIIKQRLEELKTRLVEQQVGVSAVIQDLRARVIENPELTAEELLTEVKKQAINYNLGESHLHIFKTAIDDYEQKHKLVEKYRAEFPDDKDLFEACFGQKPQGEVKVIKGAMTLHFQCQSRDDYALAYNFRKLKENEEISEEDKRKADLSAGAALYGVKIPELLGVVTLENTYWFQKYEVRTQDRTAELHKSSIDLGLDAQKGDIEIEAKNVGRWKVEMVRRDDIHRWPTRFQLVDYSGDEEKVLRDFTRVPLEGEQYFGAIKDMRALDKPPFMSYGDLLMTSREGKIIYAGKINFDYLDVKIEDQSPEGIIVRYQEDIAMPIQIDEERSKKTQIHEEQHQFNKLFMPWELHFSHWQIMLNAAEKAKSPDEAKERVIRDLVKWHRRNLVDRRARDEVLAHYSGGRNPDETYANLTENLLYNYYVQSKEEIDKLPKEISEQISKDMSLVTWEKHTDEEGYVYNNLVDALPLEVDEDAVRKQIEIVFKDDYQRDLKKWTNVIKILEQKGYVRDEVLAILAQEPARNWPGLARRLGDKHNA